MKDSTFTKLPTSINPSWKVGIVASLYHKELIDRLIEGATTLLRSAGIAAENITVYPAAGSFEIPLIGAALAKKKMVDAMIGFGVIVEGETAHARLLAEAVAHGMMDIQLQHTIPFAFEVLYVNSLDQAAARATPEQNKGAEAARAILWSLSTLTEL